MSMTLAQELTNAVGVQPILDSDEGRTLQTTFAIDNAGDFIRVFERDDPEAFNHVMYLNGLKNVFESDVWDDVVATRHANDKPTLRKAWLAMTNIEKFRYHMQRKAPRIEDAALWIGFRNGQVAHARLLDRSAIDEVWIQWIVGTKALGRSGQSLFIALWDIGVRKVYWKFIPTHPLGEGHFKKFIDMKLEPMGKYTKGSYEMTERPDKEYGRYRR